MPAGGSRSATDMSIQQRHPPRTAGFTLIEILVALAIVAIALAAVVAETTHYVYSASRLQERTLAHWVAVNRIVEQQLSATWPTAGVSDGTVELGGREWVWTLRITDTPDENIRRLDVEVRTGRDSERIDATAIAYLERPAS